MMILLKRMQVYKKTTTKKHGRNRFSKIILRRIMADRGKLLSD